MSKESTRVLLNSLVDQEYMASVGKSTTMSALLRWGEKDDFLGGNKDSLLPGLKLENWYLFEIGRNLGTVFSADVVDSIEIKDHHCIIHLKS